MALRFVIECGIISKLQKKLVITFWLRDTDGRTFLKQLFKIVLSLYMRGLNLCLQCLIPCVKNVIKNL